MVYGGFVAAVPNPVFIAIHAAALLIGLYFAMRHKGKPLFAVFLLYAGAELAYLLYHIPVFSMIFSHVVAEVLLLAAIIIAGMKV